MRELINWLLGNPILLLALLWGLGGLTSLGKRRQVGRQQQPAGRRRPPAEAAEEAEETELDPSELSRRIREMLAGKPAEPEAPPQPKPVRAQQRAPMAESVEGESLERGKSMEDVAPPIGHSLGDLNPLAVRAPEDAVGSVPDRSQDKRVEIAGTELARTPAAVIHVQRRTRLPLGLGARQAVAALVVLGRPRGADPDADIF